ncbi:hypothetical protein CBP28_05280, partial [Fischerella thermalis WC559]
YVDGKWIEVGECGEVHLDLLRSHSSGLASGWGLDCLVMLVKGIDDIRLLRSTLILKKGDKPTYVLLSGVKSSSFSHSSHCQ